VRVPSLSVQPLVENAIRHGIEPSGDGGRIDIRVALDASHVRIVISNDLPAAGSRAAPGHQVGLVSARERIHAITHGRGRLDTEVVDGRYVATVQLPLDPEAPSGTPQTPAIR
jgi:two-component system sensor histidine kinase AlgZ